MAANQAPSRVAINTLRGVVFTTSCSVVLLAEERRRRINIARSAVDNARKLHTLRSNRAPLALAEAFANEDDRYGPPPASTESSFDEQNYLVSARRRRPSNSELTTVIESKLKSGRRRQAHGTDVSADAFTSAAVLDKQNGQSLERRTRSNAESTTPVDNKSEASRSRNINNDTSAWGTALMNQLRSNARSDPFIRHGRKQRTGSIDPSSKTLPASPGYAANPEVTYQARDQPKEVVSIEERFDTAGRAPIASNVIEDISLEGLLEETQLFLGESAGSQENTSAVFSQGLELLRRLANFAQTQVSTISETQLVATDLLKRLACASHVNGESSEASDKQDTSPSKSIEGSNLADQHESNLISELVLIIQQDCTFAAPFISWICQQGNAEFLRQLKLGLYQFEGTRNEVDQPMPSATNSIGSIVHETLSSSWREHQSVKLVRQIHDMFMDTKYFQESSARTKFNSQLLVAVVEQSAGDRSRAAQLTKAVPRVDFTLCTHQQRLESILLLAQLGQWSTINRLVRSFRSERSWPAEETTKSLVELFTTQQEGNEFETSIDQFPQSIGASLEHNTIALFKYLSEARQWARICDLYEKIHASSKNPSERCLPYALQASLKSKAAVEDLPSQQERIVDIARQSHQNGNDPELMAPIIEKRLENGWDAMGLLRELADAGVAISDRVFNTAAKILLHRGSPKQVIMVCRLAAETNGEGDLLYNQYNFSNLLFSFVITGAHQDLHSLLREFIGTSRKEFGSKVCKEAIKHASKGLRRRLDIAQQSRQTAAGHVELLQQGVSLSHEALDHCKKCRESFGRQKRDMLEARQKQRSVWSESKPAATTHWKQVRPSYQDTSKNPQDLRDDNSGRIENLGGSDSSSLMDALAEMQETRRSAVA